MLIDIELVAQQYIPDIIDYSHPKIWYKIYNSSDDNKHPGDLEHVRSFKTLRQVYAYALKDREVVINCIDEYKRFFMEDDTEKYNAIYYTVTYHEDTDDACIWDDIFEHYEFKIRKFRPRDIKFGWLIRFELFTRDFGFICKIHTDYIESDYKDYDHKKYNNGDKINNYRFNYINDPINYKNEIDPLYYKEAERYVIRD